MRTPVFELHILPMIRAMDREHMRFAFDLWDYDQLVASAELFADRVAVDMPTLASGGPWPDEWVQLFRRWISTGFKRLRLGTAEYVMSHTDTTTTVRASGTFPAAGFTAWLQLEVETETAKGYVLYFEPPDVPVAGAPPGFSIRERYSRADRRSVTVRDSAGAHPID